MLTRDHVRFEFHQPFSTSISVIVDGHTIPVEVVRPTWMNQFLSRDEWKWRWKWPDGCQYQLVFPVDRMGSYATTREWLQKNGQTVAEGHFRGPRFFWRLRQQWIWTIGDESIETRLRLGCRGRRYLRDSNRRSLAVCYLKFNRANGVIRGGMDSSRTPLIMGMMLSTLVDTPGSTM